MTKSALLWFIDFLEINANAPKEAKSLVSNLKKALKLHDAPRIAKSRRIDLYKARAIVVNKAFKNPRTRTQISRVFRRHNTMAIITFVKNPALKQFIQNNLSEQTNKAYTDTLVALNSIVAGKAASEVWGLDKVRGRDTGFSKTLIAKAFADHLGTLTDDDSIPQLIYPATKALGEACGLFGTNKDNVRKYTAVTAGNKSSEAIIVRWGIEQYGLEDEADDFLDDLKAAALETPIYAEYLEALEQSRKKCND